MTYLLDTNIAIHACDGTGGVLETLRNHPDAVLLSALTLVELYRGLHRDPRSAGLRRSRLDLLLEAIPVIEFDASAAEAYGAIIAHCGWVRGRDFDRMIAAHALSTRSVLVTDNEADFRDIPGLALVNWVTRDR